MVVCQPRGEQSLFDRAGLPDHILARRQHGGRQRRKDRQGHHDFQQGEAPMRETNGRLAIDHHLAKAIAGQAEPSLFVTAKHQGKNTGFIVAEHQQLRSAFVGAKGDPMTLLFKS